MSDWLDVSDITPRIGYTATASQTAFVVPFVFFENSNLRVYHDQALLTLDVDYTVTGAEEEDGGTVTLTTGATVGDAILITRHVPIEQTTHIPPSGPLDVPAINIQLSKFVTMIQEAAQVNERSLHFPDSDAISSGELAVETTRANRLLGFGSSGEIIYPLGPDFVGETATGVAHVDSRATAQVTTFDASVNTLITAGYATPNDGGGATYKRGAGSGSFVDGSGTTWSLVSSSSSSSSSMVNVREVGAKGDGSDDYQAFADAISAAVTAGHCTVFVPPGTYDIGTMLTITNNNVVLYGTSRRTTVVRRRSGATLTNLLHIGLTSGSTLLVGVHVEGIGFDGNGSCSDSVVKLRNSTFTEIRQVRTTGSSADGFKTDTATDSINTKQLRNTFFDIISDNNGGAGYRFIGEKDGQYDSLFAHNNTSHGFVFRAFNYDGGTLAETTECTIGTILSRDNGGDGIVFDGTEKYTCGVLLAAINAGYGLRFRSSDIAASGTTASNNITIAAYTSRRNDLGGIRVADNCQMNGAQFGSVKVVGFGTTPNEEGIRIDGVANVQFNQINVVGVQGTALRIRQGTPLGGSAVQASHIQFGSVRLNSNGNASSTSNHGLSIEDNTTDVTIDSIDCSNLQTSGSNYEIVAPNSTARISIARANLNAANSGNELNTSGVVDFGRVTLRGAAYVDFIRDGITAPASNPSGMAVLFIDTADGDLKIRFSDGTLKTIVVDT